MKDLSEVSRFEESIGRRSKACGIGAVRAATSLRVEKRYKSSSCPQHASATSR